MGYSHRVVGYAACASRALEVCKDRLSRVDKRAAWMTSSAQSRSLTMRKDGSLFGNKRTLDEEAIRSLGCRSCFTVQAGPHP